MTKVVADAYVAGTGVFLRWFVDQDEFEHARELQQKLAGGSAAVEIVDFARVEVAGVLRKKGLLAGRLTTEEFTAAVHAPETSLAVLSILHAAATRQRRRRRPRTRTA